jgi:hypothetical protein
MERCGRWRVGPQRGGRAVRRRQCFCDLMWATRPHTSAAASRAVSQEAERLGEFVGEFEVGNSNGESVARRASRRDQPPALRRAVNT